MGRPVVVVNARADAMLQPKLRNRAMEYMKRRLEPIVYQVRHCANEFLDLRLRHAVWLLSGRNIWLALSGWC